MTQDGESGSAGGRGAAGVPLFDGHNDTLMQVVREGSGPFLQGRGKGHLDLPRAREAGFAGGLMAVFAAGQRLERAGGMLDRKGFPEPPFDLPYAPPLDQETAAQLTDEMAEALFAVERESAGRVLVVRDVASLEACIAEGRFAAVLHFEGAEAIREDLGNLEAWYERGLQSVGIAWSRPSAFGHGVPFRFPSGPDIGEGLTAAGKELVRRCHALGILVDVSHMNERGFWDVVRVSEQTGAPVVATHSAAHALTPISRNLTDGQLRAIRASSGMVGVNFDVRFLRPDGRLDTAGTGLDAVIRHVDHLVERLGPEGVGFGSDFDGAEVPDAIGDVRGVRRLAVALEEHGYTGEALEGLCYRNWLRVLRRAWNEGV